MEAEERGQWWGSPPRPCLTFYTIHKTLPPPPYHIYFGPFSLRAGGGGHQQGCEKGARRGRCRGRRSNRRTLGRCRRCLIRAAIRARRAIVLLRCRRSDDDAGAARPGPVPRGLAAAALRQGAHDELHLGEPASGAAHGRDAGSCAGRRVPGILAMVGVCLFISHPCNCLNNKPFSGPSFFVCTPKSESLPCVPPLPSAPRPSLSDYKLSWSFPPVLLPPRSPPLRLRPPPPLSPLPAPSSAPVPAVSACHHSRGAVTAPAAALFAGRGLSPRLICSSLPSTSPSSSGRFPEYTLVLSICTAQAEPIQASRSIDPASHRSIYH